MMWHLICADIAFVIQDLKFLREEAALLDSTLEYHIDTGQLNSRHFCEHEQGLKKVLSSHLSCRISCGASNFNCLL